MTDDEMALFITQIEEKIKYFDGKRHKSIMEDARTLANMALHDLPVLLKEFKKLKNKYGCLSLMRVSEELGLYEEELKK